MSEKLILDVTCGARTIWFDKAEPHTIYCDKREVDDVVIWRGPNGKERRITVKPDVVCDFTKLPFTDSSFNLVVFDPPHLEKVGETAWLAAKYGKLSFDWPQMLHDGFTECMRVLKPGGTLIFKWSEVDIPVKKIVEAIGYQPLFGHRSGKQMGTHWMCFMKFEDGE